MYMNIYSSLIEMDPVFFQCVLYGVCWEKHVRAMQKIVCINYRIVHLFMLYELLTTTLTFMIPAIHNLKSPVICLLLSTSR